SWIQGTSPVEKIQKEECASQYHQDSHDYKQITRLIHPKEIRLYSCSDNFYDKRSCPVFCFK
ncbi:MAG: hypothetical protein AAFV25_24865, partial [Bacteroidota bacterium]